MEKYFELTSKLIKALENSNINHLDISFEGFSLKLDKGISNENSHNQTSFKNIDINPEKTLEIEESEDVEIFKAPLLGIFYKAKDPDSKAFAEVGDTLKKGDTMCIIEAMKMMNEVKAPYDCKIVECLVENEEFVEYNKAIFKLEKIC